MVRWLVADTVSALYGDESLFKSPTLVRGSQVSTLFHLSWGKPFEKPGRRFCKSNISAICGKKTTFFETSELENFVRGQITIITLGVRCVNPKAPAVRRRPD